MRAKWRELGTEPRTQLNGHQGGPTRVRRIWPARALPVLIVFSLGWVGAWAGERPQAGGTAPSPKARGEATAAAETEILPTAGVEPDSGATDEQAVSSAAEERVDLNLLGQTDSDSGESRRNENVQFNAVDNNALRELNARLGTTATIVTEFKADRGYFGSEFGNAPTKTLHLPTDSTTDIHGSLYGSHNNSIFNARSFFQVGNVKPARENEYGFTFNAPVWKGGNFFIEGSQQKVRGSVNGNVLVPMPDERVPITHFENGEPTPASNPETRAIVERIFAAYPAELPNRLDINPRALNTNAPQRIDTDVIGARLDQALSSVDRLALRYRLTSQRVDAFQFVAGQNPDTRIQNHSARMTWARNWSPVTVVDFSVGFDRITSLLVPEANAFPSDLSFGQVIEGLGPGSTIPIDRTENFFRYGGKVSHVRGRHNLSVGLDLVRRQFNGEEVSSQRGTLSFRNDFGRDMMTNLRMGIPTRFSGALGSSHIGFRNWDVMAFAGDQWRIRPKFLLTMALRYTPFTQPFEVNDRVNVGFPCDCNNVGGHIGFAYNLPGRWGVLRGAYGLHYAEVYPATYHQVRFTPPQVFKIVVANPDLAAPLGGLTIEDVDPNQRATVFQNDSRLVSPYSQQYNFSWEPMLGRDWGVQLGYVGSRSQKLFLKSYTNRAGTVDDLDQMTTGTVNDRRPNERYFDIRKIINSSRGYFDAARATLKMSEWHRVSVDASYWFSKAIDLGAGYTDTGSGISSLSGRNQSEFLIHEDLRGPSSFDQKHAFLGRLSYLTPDFTSSQKWMRQAFGQWTVAAVTLIKSGTPFTLRSGSDAPGFGNVDGSSGDRPHIIDPTILGRTIGHPDTSASLLPISAFAFMERGEARGNIGRNTFRRDGVQNINASLSRTWYVSAEKSLTLRAESINLFNTPQFAEPGLTLSSPDFGQITNTLNDGRTFRFLLKFLF